MNIASRVTAPLLLLAGIVTSAPFAAPRSALAATTYVYVTFKGDAVADEERWVYTSTNATNFGVYADTNYHGPTGVLRDPSIIKHTDGKYYIAYTVQSWTTQSTHFNVASSTDLRSWTHVASVNAGVAGTAYTWAPEFFVEGGTIRLIVSLGTSSHQFSPYVYTAQNGALSAWSGPVTDNEVGKELMREHLDVLTYNAFTPSNNDWLDLVIARWAVEYD